MISVAIKTLILLVLKEKINIVLSKKVSTRCNSSEYNVAENDARKIELIQKCCNKIIGVLKVSISGIEFERRGNHDEYFAGK